jgi:hypothetical protein
MFLSNFACPKKLIYLYINQIMQVTKENLNECVQKLLPLEPDKKPLWGKFSAQAMVERLIDSVVISNGKFQLPCLFEGLELEERRKFLWSGAPFPKNIQNPFVENRPLRAPSLAAATKKLTQELDIFHQYFTDNPESTFIHPFFGELKYQDWIYFHIRHFTHHFIQFELIIPEQEY